MPARIKSVAIEREKIRARERARLPPTQSAPACATSRKAYMRQIVDRFNLQKALADENTVTRLRMAGFRGQAPLVVFLFARARPAARPLRRRAASICSWSSISTSRRSLKILFAVAFAYIGFYAPNLYIANIISKRQTSIRRAWPDALDLLLICVEFGMSAEAAFRKVSEEIGAQSVAARRGTDADHGRAVLSAANAGRPTRTSAPAPASRPSNR